MTLVTTGETERTACPLCRSGRATTTRYGREPFGVERCLACGVYYLSPRLPESDMLAFYREGRYFAGGAVGYCSYEQQGESLGRTFRRVLDRLAARDLTGGSLLDLGCGHGLFLEAARGRFDRRVGTEMSEEAAAVARERADLVYVGGIEQLPPQERFDFIAAIQVVEHVYAPRSFIRGLLDHLRPGGSLFVATPDMGSWWRKLLGSRWPSFKFPEHVVYYDRATLRSLLTGFEDVVELTEVPYPHAFPLSVVGEKLGLRVPGPFRNAPVWIPATTIAMVAGRRSGSGMGPA